MTFKKFFYSSILLTISIITVFVSFNVYMNEYGLFGNAKGRLIEIWYNERTSKYLLSYNYIPANFEGLLIGPSVSDNINTKKISGFKIYNASINGGNISELKYIAENVIQRGNLKFIIICLYPYITHDHGRKTSSIDEREYWSALGSKETLNFYLNKMLISLDLKPHIFSDYGYNNLNLIIEKPITGKTKSIIKSHAPKKNRINQKEFVDEIAYNELAEIINLSRKKGIKIFAYYHPYYIENYHEERFRPYKEKIDKLFDKRDIIWDFNTDEHLAFRSDLSNYCDRWHLTRKGTDYLIREINNKLNLFYKRNSNDSV